jgi:CDP-paratose 2-epimerase
MKIALITGSCGLVGSETCKRLHAEGMAIVGVDNDMRRYFFGDEASTEKTRQELRKLQIYVHEDLDIRDWNAV